MSEKEVKQLLQKRNIDENIISEFNNLIKEAEDFKSRSRYKTSEESMIDLRNSSRKKTIQPVSKEYFQKMLTKHEMQDVISERSNESVESFKNETGGNIRQKIKRDFRFQSNNMRSGLKKVSLIIDKKETRQVVQTLTNNTNRIRRNSEHKIEDKKNLFNGDFSYYCGEIDKYTLQFCGEGELFTNDECYYKGFFRNGKKFGYGFFYMTEMNSNSIYMGEFFEDKFHGYGELVTLFFNHDNTKIFQKGEFKNGEFVEGVMLKIKETEDVSFIDFYNGKLVNDLYHDDRASITRKQYKRVKEGNEGSLEFLLEFDYEGRFKKGFEEGYGKCIVNKKNLPYKIVYRGAFRRGYMHGYGSAFFTGKYYVKHYEGLFEYGKWFSQYGVVEFSSGDYYEGFFDKQHAKNSVGMYKHKNSRGTYDHYFGIFHNDKKVHKGVFFSSSNKTFSVGDYLDGEKHGEFELIRYHDNLESKATRSSQNESISWEEVNLKEIGNAVDELKVVKQKKFILFEGDEVIICKESKILDND